MREVVTAAALARRLMRHDPVSNYWWTILEWSDYLHSTRMLVQHNVTGERFELVVRKVEFGPDLPTQPNQRE